MEEPNQKQNSRPTWGFLFLTVLLVVMTLFVAYLFWQQQILLSQNRSSSPIENLQKQVNDQEKLFTQLSNRRDDANQNSIAYLVNLANVQLIVLKDAETAKMLLKLALEKIQPNQMELKKSLEQDLARLSALPTFDREAVVLALDRLNQQIAGLSALPNLNFQAKNLPQEKKIEGPWYQRFFASFSGLKELFVIRRVDQNITPLISPQNEVYLKENIQTKIFQAQWAALNQKPILYQASLKNIIFWLQKYFHNPQALQPILGSLNQLQSINVKPNYPSLDNSLRLLEIKTISPLQNSPPAPKTPEKSPAVPKPAKGVMI